MTPQAEYTRRLAAWRQRIAALDRRHLVVSNGRLAAAAAIAATAWMAFVRAALSPLWPAAGALVFLALVVVHAHVLLRLERARRAERVYLRALERLAGRWAGTGRDSERFLEDHPYARDLDLFGRASLFELLNATRTEAGEGVLADWLRAGAGADEVAARQIAVDELRRKIDFREEISVLAAETEISRTGALAAWASAPPVGITAATARVVAACAVVMIAVVALALWGAVAWRWVAVWFVVEYAIALRHRGAVGRVIGAIATPERDLSLLVDLMVRIESETFEAPRLGALKSALLTRGVPPSRRIAQLRQYVSWLDSIRNQLFAPIAYALLLPQLIAVAIDRWHARYGAAVVAWIGAIGELEALSAIGTYAFEHPADPFPTVTVDGGVVFDADALGHPLMLDSVAVRNDVRLGGGESGPTRGPRVIVISGSNMSGKSTLLRAVGVNAVLALAGAPVRAARLRLSPVSIGATLRIEDSLEAGHSRFYTEILRIKAIVDLARHGNPLLFLLDEILHGTNSHDRRIGAEAIVRSLVAQGAIGLVTTHDLALTELPPKLGAAAANMHFADRIEHGRMVFDYLMQPGVVDHSNALELMRSIGLEL